MARARGGTPVTLVGIGRLGRPHGLAGELALDRCPLTPQELLAMRDVVWRRHEEERALVVEAVRPLPSRLLVRFRGHGEREAVTDLVGGELLVDAQRLPDPGPGVAYSFQIVGLRVETEDGRLLGTVAEILATAANPVYVVRGAREWLIPVVEPVVKRVDLDRGVITVALPAGLEEL